LFNTYFYLFIIIYYYLFIIIIISDGHLFIEEGNHTMFALYITYAYAIIFTITLAHSDRFKFKKNKFNYKNN
jgi:membrane protein YdbS with pleckstrin-like domain